MNLSMFIFKKKWELCELNLAIHVSFMKSIILKKQIGTINLDKGFIVVWELKPCYSDFRQNKFLAIQEYQPYGAQSVKILNS